MSEVPGLVCRGTLSALRRVAGAYDRGTVSNDGDARERVLIGYGEVMSVVQHWEQALAILWWRTTRKSPGRPTGDFNTARSQKEILRLEAAFLRMTAQAVRDAVSPHLDPETAANLPALMDDRNRLAHRFLREQATEGGWFEAGTHDQLIALGNRFMDSYEAIVHEVMKADPYTGPVPSHWPDLADRITDRLARGERIPRDPQQQ